MRRARRLALPVAALMAALTALDPAADGTAPEETPGQLPLPVTDSRSGQPVPTGGMP
ncbi:hypothetical protein [Streptomyces specialis]|uniref:hypothetical protein n=1 Tax=Streptomyces specialis TaxID=498367 RepID=UPI000A89976D|nr:hypothetical protein [Streptomyces specialis]